MTRLPFTDIRKRNAKTVHIDIPFVRLVINVTFNDISVIYRCAGGAKKK